MIDSDIKFVQISAVTKIIGRFSLIGTRLNLIPIIIKMLLDCGIVLYMDTFFLSADSIMCVYQP